MSSDIQEILSAVEAAQGADSVDISPPPAPVGDRRIPLGVPVTDPVNGVLDYAEVRELNGYDEEIISRTRTQGTEALAIIERGVDSVGGVKATKKVLDRVAMSDRVELMLAVRTATWGDEVDVRASCDACGESTDTSVSLVDDVPRTPVPDKGGDFIIELPSGREAIVGWPSGAFHTRLLSGEWNTGAEMTTGLIVDCVREIDGMPLLQGEVSAKALPLRDRREIYKQVMEAVPGPKLDQVKIPCPVCGSEVEIAIPAGALFPA